MGFPTAMVNILDEDTQHTITQVGLVDRITTPREDALCDEVIRTGRPMVIEDAASDSRFGHSRWVSSGALRTFVGVPLMGRESLPIGVICVVDPEPRQVDADQLARLIEFGKVVEDQLDLMRRLKGQLQQGAVATAELARAIRLGEIVPWYQGTVELSTGRVVGYEALARWVRPSGEVVSPNSFIPLAEDSDLIIDLDLAVIGQAMADLHRWQISDPALRMSVNLSSRHFDRPDWITTVTAAVTTAGVRPESVSLELTETEHLPAGDSDGMFVDQLQQRGFRVLLDDFGTGWSSLEYLLRLPADGIKIDRVMSLALGTPIGDALVGAIARLARNLNLSLTVEGIETPRQAALALAMGCQFGQGYLWSRPVPAADVAGRSAPAGPPPTGTSSVGPAAVPEDAPLGHPKSGALGWEPELGPQLAAAVLEVTPDATAVLDEHGTIVAINRSWRMFALDNGGTEASIGVGVNYLQVCERAARNGCAEAGQVYADLSAVLAGQYREAELEYPCPSPAIGRWFLLRISRLSGLTSGAVVSHVNITRRKMAEDELAHGASHDPLTGLANRTLLNARLTKALARPRDGVGTGVLVLDLDEFKAVNDTYGHAAGDEVLQTVAHRLRGLVRPGDTIGRLGGDEFAVVIPGTGRPRIIELTAAIRASLARPHRIYGRSVTVGASVGSHLAVGDNPEEAMHTADIAMYAAKQQRKLHRAGSRSR